MVADVVGELGELVEDEVLRVLLQFVTGVVDLFDVALRARGSDHVARIGDPLIQPLETFPAHVLGEHGYAATAHEP